MSLPPAPTPHKDTITIPSAAVQQILQRSQQPTATSNYSNSNAAATTLPSIPPASTSTTLSSSSSSSHQSELIAITKDLTAGTIGACAGIVIGQPLDTIRVRVQTSATRISSLECFTQTVRNEGVRALFRGLSSPLLANAPINMLVFAGRGQMSRFLDEEYPRTAESIVRMDPEYWRSAVSASYAGVLQLSICIPFELIKCKLQVQAIPIAATSTLGTTAAAASSTASSTTASLSSPLAPLTAASSSSQSQPQRLYTGTYDCVRHIYSTQGLRGLYAGSGVTFLRDVPAYAAWFLAYDITKNSLQTKQQLSDRTPVSTTTTLVAGSVAGVATWISTYPLDVIKSVIQTLPDSTPKHEKSVMYVTRQNYAKEGLSFFWRGLAPTLVRAVPVSAVTFLVYEACMDVMGR